MKKILIGLFIFILILFIYIHIYFQLKTSNDLEIYEIEQASKDKIEEICDIRQPVIFDFNSEKIIQYSNKSYILNNYSAFEIKVRNTKDTKYDSEILIPLPLHSANTLFTEDKTGIYFSENNSEFLQETGIIKHFQYNDEFLRPYMVSNCNYDIMIGSQNTITPFRYELNYRNYFLVTEGSVQLKLTPPKNSKYLYPVYDYENFEFRSPINAWNPQKQYIADFDKVKCLEITLSVGQTIQIPAYWWYSFKFTKDSSISCFRYRTYMNNISISPHILLYGLQLQNIKRDAIKKLDIVELNNTQKIQTSIKESEDIEKIEEDNVKEATNIDDLNKENK
jgi:hypothetical protein